MGPQGSLLNRSPDPAVVKRVREAWVDPDMTLDLMVRKSGLSEPKIKKLCADLPPRIRPQRLKRQAPSGLRGIL